MLLLGFLLALSLATAAVVLVAAESQARAARGSTQVLTVHVSERRRFELLVAPLLADPDFGRIDRSS
jgi:hypothetical protein